MAFIKDNDKTKTDFASYDEAWLEAQKIKASLKDPTEQEYRVRIRPRSRTQKWDVVVKVKRA